MSDSLLDLRERQGFSQAGLAGLVGVDRSTIRRWEAGKTDVGVGSLVPLGRALEVPVQRIVEAVSQTQLDSEA